MVIRTGYRAHIKEGKENDLRACIESYRRELWQEIEAGKLITLSFFIDQRRLFLHMEWFDASPQPDVYFSALTGFLETFAGEDQPRFFVPMADIFHYNRPTVDEDWKRKTAPENSFAMILRLRPEQMSSYIFYHYQLQEEHPGKGDKFGVIWLHENLMCFYLERPEVREAPKYKGKLSTNASPQNWQEVMREHFLPWEDGTLWKPIEVLLFV